MAFDKLTGPKKELNFKSNPFAIMLKANPELAVDTNYYRYRALRKTNFQIGLKLDSSYRFNGFSSGITYALIDKRDSSTSTLLFENLVNDSLANEANQLQVALRDFAMTLPIDQRKPFVKAMSEFFNKKAPFSSLDPTLQTQVKAILNADPATYPHIANFVNNRPSSNMFTEQKKVYDSLKNLIKKDLLWTISLTDTTYKNQFVFSNILLKTHLLKGVGKPKPGSNWEFNIQLSVNFVDDSLSAKRDLKRSILNFEPGLNWVIRNKKNDQSILEFQFSGSYNHNFGRLYATEKRDNLTFNGTLRIRIISDIWIPLEYKYDPKSGNLFGFINVRANFKALGNLVKGI